MNVKGASHARHAEALEDAMTKAPREGTAPWRYSVQRSWVEDGGVVGRILRGSSRDRPGRRVLTGATCRPGQGRFDAQTASKRAAG